MPDALSSQHRFAIAFSFPGEHRAYVESVAKALLPAFGGAKGKTHIFYDAWHEGKVIGYGSNRKLQKIYATESNLIIPFYCEDYLKKKWCGVELRAVEELLFNQEYDRVLPFRFDMVEIPGSFKTDVFPVITNRPASEIAGLILERLNELQQTKLKLPKGSSSKRGAVLPSASSTTLNPTRPTAPLAAPSMLSSQALKLLYVSASPRDNYPLDVDAEIRDIKKAVLATRFRDNLHIHAEPAVLADDFASCVHDNAPQILHLSGYHNAPHRGGIMLMDGDNNSKPVEKKALLHVLGSQHGLRMVVLNTCYSLTTAEELARKIDFAIGVEDGIEDKASVQFAKVLYAALANGHPVQSAYDQAITHMIGAWPKKNIPQLCVNKRIIAAETALIGNPSPHPEAQHFSITPRAPAPDAIKVWQKKLLFLQTEEAKAGDAEQKFSIQQRIEEALAKIEELENQ